VGLGGGTFLVKKHSKKSIFWLHRWITDYTNQMQFYLRMQFFIILNLEYERYMSYWYKKNDSYMVCILHFPMIDWPCRGMVAKFPLFKKKSSSFGTFLLIKRLVFILRTLPRSYSICMSVYYHNILQYVECKNVQKFHKKYIWNSRFLGLCKNYNFSRNPPPRILIFVSCLEIFNLDVPNTVG